MTSKLMFFFVLLFLNIAACSAPAPAAVKPAPAQTKTTLRAQADLYFGNEDEEREPVETNFYLLDASLVDILKEAKFKPIYPDGEKRRATEEDYLEAAAKIFGSREV